MHLGYESSTSVRPTPVPGVLQRAATGLAGRAPAPIVHEVLASPGRPLGSPTQSLMKRHLGHDFGHVRLHTDEPSRQSARSVNARAYTVGSHIVFGAGAYRPEAPAGQRLIAHELTHVVQQAGSSPPRDLVVGPGEDAAEREAQTVASSVDPLGVARHSQAAAEAGVLRRDLATPEPNPPPAANPELTDSQVRTAINFNSQLYDAANTRLIQDLLGGPVTGRWTRANIEAIASVQQQYGLKKDGMVGPDTFRFIEQEQALEGAGTTTPECLTMFRVTTHPVLGAPTAGPGGTTRIRGHHVVEARFSSRCNCSEFQYRQFIAGVATASRGGRIDDLSRMFSHIPGGRLPLAMTQDGNTGCRDRNYGHRDQPGQDQTAVSCGEDHYTDDAGSTDQTNGCRYRAEDFPSINVTGLASGDVVDLLVQFRGEIRRNNRVIQTREWTTIDNSLTTP